MDASAGRTASVHRAARETALPRRVMDARIAFRAAGRIYAPITRPRRSEGILTMHIGAARRILDGVDFMIGAVRRLLEGRSFQSDEPVETRRELSGRYLRELQELVDHGELGLAASRAHKERPV